MWLRGNVDRMVIIRGKARSGLGWLGGLNLGTRTVQRGGSEVGRSVVEQLDNLTVFHSLILRNDTVLVRRHLR